MHGRQRYFTPSSLFGKPVFRLRDVSTICSPSAGVHSHRKHKPGGSRMDFSTTCITAPFEILGSRPKHFGVISKLP
jgi:hypothetical protein